MASRAAIAGPLSGEPGRRANRRAREAWAWLSEHDPGHAALRRAGRAGLLMPLVFAFADQSIGNPVIATFAAFGSFAMLLLVDFSGPIRDRLLDQAALGVACAVLIAAGTLASRATWLAAVTMALVGVAILFAGIVSSVLAGATTPLLLAFILPVSLPASAAAIPDRVAGWGLAAALSLPAIALLWPAPVRNPLRAAAADTVGALADRLRADVAWVTSHRDPADRERHREAVTNSQAAVERLGSVFLATPYRPTGLTTEARAVVRLVDELRWLAEVVLRAAPPDHPPPPDPQVCEVKLAAAEVLERCEELLTDASGPSEPAQMALARLADARVELEEAVSATIRTGRDPAPKGADPARQILNALDPSFRAQELAFIIDEIGRNVEAAAAATRRRWLDRLLGHQPTGLPGPWTSARVRAGAHLDRSSVWLHNSLRGGAALGIAVLVADLSGVQHGFWVVFGTLSVLRSNALSTGQNVVRALLGTTLGFIVGGALVALIGTSTGLLWALLPIAVLLAGLAPSAISFTAGQAAFTLTLLILFNLIAPAGWTIGLLRVEDIALGGAVSLLVGVLFWPRGAATSLRHAVAQAYGDAANYLTAAVADSLDRCDGSAVHAAARPRADIAAASARRLDDAFRAFLAERGAKRLPLTEASRLVGGAAAVRLAGDAVLALWRDGEATPGDWAAARRELTAAARRVGEWYSGLGASLESEQAVNDPVAAEAGADGRLLAAVDQDLLGRDGAATRAAVRVIWTGDHIDAVRRLQEQLVEPARTVAAQRAFG